MIATKVEIYSASPFLRLKYFPLKISNRVAESAAQATPPVLLSLNL